MDKTKKRKVIIIVIIVLAAAAMAYISLFPHFEALINQIKDTNGADDISPAILTEEELRQNPYAEKYYCLGAKFKHNTKTASGVNGEFEERDSDYYEIQFKKMSGVYIANAYLGSGNTVTFEVDSKLTSGNLRIVITNESGEFLFDIDANTKDSVQFVSEEGKVYYLKFIGESATFTSVVTRVKTYS